MDWLELYSSAVASSASASKQLLSPAARLRPASLATPPTGEIWRSYYSAGSGRIAMRMQQGVTNEVSYLLSDHLGSTSISTNALGAITSELRYLPFGGERSRSGTMHTAYKYTGQRFDEAIGLY